jgi:hypothetical protein
MTLALGKMKRLPLAPAARSGHVGADELHRVVDRETRRHRPAWRADVEVDVAIRIFFVEVEERPHDDAHLNVVHFLAEDDDAIFQEQVEQAVAALASGVALHHRGNLQGHLV